LSKNPAVFYASDEVSFMQRVTNCVFFKDGKVLMLRKPSRGFWALPGGKMEPKETVKEAVVREYLEETGIRIKDPVLKSISTFLVDEGNGVHEWMMFTFLAKDGEGQTKETTDEGILQWQPVQEIGNLPMAEGDRFIIRHALNGNEIMYNSFHYSSDYRLLSYRLDPELA
jgi:8-oxo-dGTP diphosphatase